MTNCNIDGKWYTIAVKRCYFQAFYFMGLFNNIFSKLYRKKDLLQLLSHLA